MFNLSLSLPYPSSSLSLSWCTKPGLKTFFEHSPFLEITSRKPYKPKGPTFQRFKVAEGTPVITLSEFQ